LGSYVNAEDGCDIGAYEAGASTVPAEIDIQLLLEGPYTNVLMSTALNSAGQLPTDQPFDTAPWNYNGNETVAGPPIDMVDWMYVSFRRGGPEDVGGLLNPFNRAFYAVDNGDLAIPNGSNSIRVDPGWWYLVIDHRNHIPVMTATPVYLKWGQTTTYDFRTSADKAYGSPVAMKDLSGGFFGLFAGDANADGIVQALDFNVYIAQTLSGATGYQPADLTMDGQVQALDFNLYLANTLAGATSQVP
jgi:hypothetical protein